MLPWLLRFLMISVDGSIFSLIRRISNLDPDFTALFGVNKERGARLADDVRPSCNTNLFRTGSPELSAAPDNLSDFEEKHAYVISTTAKFKAIISSAKDDDIFIFLVGLTG